MNIEGSRETDVHIDSGKGIGWGPYFEKACFFVQCFYNSEIAEIVNRSLAAEVAFEGLDQTHIGDHKAVTPSPIVKYTGIVRRSPNLCSPIGHDCQ